MQSIIEVINGVPRHPSYRMKEPVNFVMNRGEQIALIGSNGGGKSLLVDILIGRWPLLMNEVKYDFTPSASSLACDNIKYITFRDSYGDADGTFYYQQRWNSQDMEITPLVRELLPDINDVSLKANLFSLFGLQEMMDKHIVLLSSGELRKFQLVKALLTQPKVLILDNPFIGLDTSTRDLLRELLEKMIRMMSLQVILVLSREDEIPPFITHIVPVEGLVCGEKVEWNESQNEATMFENGKEDESHSRTCSSPLTDNCKEEILATFTPYAKEKNIKATIEAGIADFSTSPFKEKFFLETSILSTFKNKNSKNEINIVILATKNKTLKPLFINVSPTAGAIDVAKAVAIPNIPIRSENLSFGIISEAIVEVAVLEKARAIP